MHPEVRLVRGDSRSYIELSFGYGDASPVNLSHPGITVVVKFREPGTDPVLFSRACTKVSGGAAGVVRLTLPSEAEGALAGRFEAEAEIDFDGEPQTIYDRFIVLVRERFG